MDMSSSKADAVTIAFGSLLLSPVETLGGCALPLSDQGSRSSYSKCVLMGGPPTSQSPGGVWPASAL